MRISRINKQISIHRVSLDIAWCHPYCCTTVDTTFVTLKDTESRTRTSARPRSCANSDSTPIT